MTLEELSASVRTLVLRKQDVCDQLRVSRAHLDRLRAAGQFVAPVRLGAQAIGFLAKDVEAWLASRPRADQ
jgi:prophage regulatory protein